MSLPLLKAKDLLASCFCQPIKKLRTFAHWHFHGIPLRKISRTIPLSALLWLCIILFNHPEAKVNTQQALDQGHRSLCGSEACLTPSINSVDCHRPELKRRLWSVINSYQDIDSREEKYKLIKTDILNSTCKKSELCGNLLWMSSRASIWDIPILIQTRPIFEWTIQVWRGKYLTRQSVLDSNYPTK